MNLNLKASETENEILEAITKATYDILPEKKSTAQYEKAFMNWCKKNVKNLGEKTLLAYFAEPNLMELMLSVQVRAGNKTFMKNKSIGCKLKKCIYIFLQENKVKPF